MCLGVFLILLLDAFVDHEFAELGILSHLANQGSSDVVVVIYEMSLIKCIL